MVKHKREEKEENREQKEPNREKTKVVENLEDEGESHKWGK